jgi:salicylate synthetase
MARFKQQIILPGAEFPLETAVALLDYYSKNNYYVYERGDTWYLGLGAHASLVLDPKGETATEIDNEGRKESMTITDLPTDQVRQFVSKYSSHGKIFGQVGFNYSARCSGQAYAPSQWPMLSLMVPRVQVIMDRIQITVTGHAENDAYEVSERIKGIIKSISIDNIYLPSESRDAIDLSVDAGEYKGRVANAIADIAKGRYTKAIPSRKVPLDFRVDMLATLLHGRRANTPARTFSLNHMGMQATGFSPEVLLSIEDGNVYTEALAGTQLSESPEASLDPFDNKLHNDAKEVMEHVIAIKGSIRRLSQVCLPESISIKDFMKVMPRGSVQHLFSHVRGLLRSDCDGWDALPGLIANITVPGMPGQGNLEAIRCFEPEPRDLYCGAVLVLDECSNLFDATLVLRTVFQDANRQWLQAGAGVTSYSNPEREFAETCEKLESVAPFVMPQHDSLGFKSKASRAHLRSQGR